MIDPTKINPEVLYTTPEASALIGMGDELPMRMRAAGIGPVGRSKRPFFWRGSDLLKYIGCGPTQPTQAERRRQIGDAHKRLKAMVGS